MNVSWLVPQGLVTVTVIFPSSLIPPVVTVIALLFVALVISQFAGKDQLYSVAVGSAEIEYPYPAAKGGTEENPVIVGHH